MMDSMAHVPTPLHVPPIHSNYKAGYSTTYVQHTLVTVRAAKLVAIVRPATYV